MAQRRARSITRSRVTKLDRVAAGVSPGMLPMWDGKPGEHAECPTCGRSVRLRRDGRVSSHKATRSSIGPCRADDEGTL